jgi:serine/threonine protein kinase
LLGVGATSAVWQGVPRGGGPDVALKHVPRRLADALPEAAALAALEHPNLVGVRAVRRRPHSTVLVLDLAAGGSLTQLLARRKALPPGEVVGALTPIAAALAAVHGAGLVHGDVHPGNVLFGADGLPVLSDLGSAYWLDDEPPATLPPPGFSDPLTEHGVVAGPAGDVYGVAALAYTALVGAELPTTPTEIATSQSARQQHHDRAATALSAVPEPLRSVVLAGLSLDVRARPSAQELALALRYSVPMTGVDLDAGRHTVLAALPVLTRGARVPVTANADRSPSRRRLRWLPGPRSRRLPRPSR